MFQSQTVKLQRGGGGTRRDCGVRQGSDATSSAPEGRMRTTHRTQQRGTPGGEAAPHRDRVDAGALWILEVWELRDYEREGFVPARVQVFADHARARSPRLNAEHLSPERNVAAHRHLRGHARRFVSTPI